MSAHLATTKKLDIMVAERLEKGDELIVKCLTNGSPAPLITDSSSQTAASVFDRLH